MGFTIYQREKTQAIDLLDRVSARLCEECDKVQGDDDAEEALDLSLRCLTKLTNEIENKLSNVANQTIDLDELARARHQRQRRHGTDEQRQGP